ncbi:hypothetical protein EMIHUDRAFT_121847, partial [Emiliania huxleyi CCMP1516]
YTNATDLGWASGKRVLVVGWGNSGSEIALDLVEHGARPTLLARSPQVVVPRDHLQAGYGEAHELMAAWARREEPSRLLQYESCGGLAPTDILCPMYPTVEQYRRMDTLPGQLGSSSVNGNGSPTRTWPARADGPLIPCEFAHAMGNSTGNFAEWWEEFRRASHGQGGFVWDWIDQGLARVDAATAEHRGDGVDRRNAHHERSARERSEREAGMRAFEPPPDEEGAVEHLSASVVLAAVEESGPNYLLPKAPEPVKSRRKRLMVDEAARQAGQAILETGTRVEIFAEDSGEERWWPGTIMERTEDTDGRLVHRVQYTNFEGDRYWHVLDDEQWRRVADTGPELEHARAGAGDAALRDGASLAASRPTRWDNARGETAGGASETTGGAGSAETTGQAGSAPDLNWPGRRRVRRSAAMELLRTRDEAEQREARRPDVAPMLTPHSATLSRHLVWVRRLLREYLAELAEDGLSVPMQRTSRGLHPTMRWTVEFGKWLATYFTASSFTICSAMAV